MSGCKSPGAADRPGSGCRCQPEPERWTGRVGIGAGRDGGRVGWDGVGREGTADRELGRSDVTAQRCDPIWAYTSRYLTLLCPRIILLDKDARNIGKALLSHATSGKRDRDVKNVTVGGGGKARDTPASQSESSHLEEQSQVGLHQLKVAAGVQLSLQRHQEEPQQLGRAAGRRAELTQLRVQLPRPEALQQTHHGVT